MSDTRPIPNNSMLDAKLIPGRAPSVRDKTPPYRSNPPVRLDPINTDLPPAIPPQKAFSVSPVTHTTIVGSQNLVPSISDNQVNDVPREVTRKRSATFTSVDALSIRSVETTRHHNNSTGTIGSIDESSDKSVNDKAGPQQSPHRSQSASNIRKAHSVNRQTQQQQLHEHQDEISNNIRRIRSATTSNIDQLRVVQGQPHGAPKLHPQPPTNWRQSAKLQPLQNLAPSLKLQSQFQPLSPHQPIFISAKQAQALPIAQSTSSTFIASPVAPTGSLNSNASFISSNSPFNNVRRIDNNSETSLNPESPTWLLSDLLAGFSSSKDMDEYEIVAKGNSLVLLFQQNPTLKNEILIKNILSKIQFMFQHYATEVRSIGYKLLRYTISSYESLIILVQNKILIHIILTMSSSRSSLVEKEQALKLIREFLTIENGTDSLSIGVIKSLIALIESNNEVLDVGASGAFGVGPTDIADDHNGQITSSTSQDVPESFKMICIETICEISLLKPELIFYSGGFKIMINTIIDGSIAMSSNCLFVIFKLLDFKKSRRLLRNGYDLISLLSIFSTLNEQETTQQNGSDKKKSSTRDHNRYTTNKLQKMSFLVTLILKNFNGLMAFSIYDYRMLRELISNLKKKNDMVREYILDILFDVLGIKSLPWLATSQIGESIKKFNAYLNVPNSTDMFDYSSWEQNTTDQYDDSFETKLVDHYRGLITFVLIKIELLEYLVDIIDQNTNPEITAKATLLLTNIYAIAANLLPTELVQNNTVFSNITLRSSFEIDKVTRNKFVPSKKYNSSLKVHLRKIQIASRYNVEDLEFKAMINNTKILTIKEFEDWNWNLLSALIQGPLSNPKRFDEVLEKNPKFFKRLMSFYRPFKFRFCNIPVSMKNSSKFINTGCQLIELFLNLDSGIKYLSTNKILPQLTEIFAQIDPYSGISTKEPVLSRKRLENTISYGYLKFIGKFSSSTAGLRMLDHWQFFTLFQNLIDTSIEDDVNNLLIISLFKNIDFSMDSQFRIILLKSLKVSNLKIRTFVIHELLPRLIKDKECEVFVIKILVSSLYDSNKSVVKYVIGMLHEYYQSRNYDRLDFLINLKPSIRILSSTEVGMRLLFNFFQIPAGFKFLEDSGFIEEEFNRWAAMKGFWYLNEVEGRIRSRFFPFTIRKKENFSTSQEGSSRSGSIATDFFVRETTVSTPMSIDFFKQLLSTEEGLNYFSNFKQRNYLDQLINEIEVISNQIKTRDGFENLDNQDETHIHLINTLKQDLWIVGNIASAKYGIQLLDPIYSVSLNRSIIVTILDLFETCSIWQIRGLCFYVVGMISSTIEGIEILDELDWLSVCDQYGDCKGLAYPKGEVSDIFKIEITNPYRDDRFWVREQEKGSHGRPKGDSSAFSGDDLWSHSSSTSSLELVDNTDDEEKEFLYTNSLQKIHDKIIHHIHLLNSVLGKIERKSYKELTKMKKLNPEIFDNASLFLEVVRLIDRGNFKYHKRKFIFDLFLDTKVLESLARKERKNSMKN